MSDLVIERIPLTSEERKISYDQNSSCSFKPLPFLYLELIENKTKLNPTVLRRGLRGSKGIVKPTVKSSTSVSTSASTSSAASSTIPTASTVTSGIATTTGLNTSSESNNGASASSTASQSIPVVVEEEEISEEERINREKSNLYFQYLVLKQMYPNAVEIPAYNVYTDVNIMRQKYDMLSKQLSLDNSVESWKRYMAMFVMGCEILFGQLNFDMEGFAHHQIMNMNSYDQLLVELAEKTYVPKGSKWPVEVRLLGMLILNMAIFIFQKMISKSVGNSGGSNNLLTLINNFSSRLATNAVNASSGNPPSTLNNGSVPTNSSATGIPTFMKGP